MKLRESGGVGSDMQLMMDGFSGKHVKVFIDGVPQEGVGSSFSINNIPVNFAERIEVYKGVVPVGFGTDAIGGVINIVTNKRRHNWFLDASYSYGSFNTHKSYINFGQSFKNGLTYEINAFQNYSDNSYSIDSPVEDFETGRIDRNNKEHVKRFNDTYHNEAVIAKVGVTGKSWADRMMFGFTYSNMYKEVQNGVRQ
jgi:outer membrane cobalamin receptor